MGDRIFGGIGLVVAAFFIWQATQIQLSFISDPFGPKVFPYMIGTVLALASLAIMLRPDAAPKWPEAARLAEIGVAAVVLFAYAYALPIAGFIIATTLAAAYLSWRLGTKPVQALLAGVAISIGIYVVFHLILGLSLARGPLGF